MVDPVRVEPSREENNVEYVYKEETLMVDATRRGPDKEE